jgi:hypothetical protein
MELFPATSESAWDLIKGVIDDSDYYCLILGGRYGSVDVDGIGFTEREYDYAVSAKKPLIAFVHGKPGEIPVSKSEASDKGRKRLAEFIKKIEANHHRFLEGNVKVSWDTILRYVGPALINECTDDQLSHKLQLCFFHAAQSTFGSEVQHGSIVVRHVVKDEITIQLRALGHIVPGTKRRAVAQSRISGSTGRLPRLGSAV